MAQFKIGDKAIVKVKSDMHLYAHMHNTVVTVESNLDTYYDKDGKLYTGYKVYCVFSDSYILAEKNELVPINDSNPPLVEEKPLLLEEA